MAQLSGELIEIGRAKCLASDDHVARTRNKKKQRRHHKNNVEHENANLIVFAQTNLHKLPGTYGERVLCIVPEASTTVTFPNSF